MGVRHIMAETAIRSRTRNRSRKISGRLDPNTPSPRPFQHGALVQDILSQDIRSTGFEFRSPAIHGGGNVGKQFQLGANRSIGLFCNRARSRCYPGARAKLVRSFVRASALVPFSLPPIASLSLDIASKLYSCVEYDSAVHGNAGARKEIIRAARR